MNSLKNLTVLLFLLATTTFYSQEKKDWDKIKSLKVAYFTEQLELSTSEAEAFWPVYNEYEKERYLLRKNEHGQLRSKMKNSETLSDKEANDLLDRYFATREKEHELDKGFITKISKVISAKKALKLIRAEEDFKRKLIRQYHKKRNEGGNIP